MLYHIVSKNSLFVCSLVQDEEFYVCIYATREGDQVLFYHEGGVEVGDVDSKAQRLIIAVDGKLSDAKVKEQLLTHVPDDKKEYGLAFVFLSMFLLVLS